VAIVKSRTRGRWSRQAGWINYGFWCPPEIAAKIRQMTDDRLTEGLLGSDSDMIRSLIGSGRSSAAQRVWKKKANWVRFGLTWPPDVIRQLRFKQDRNTSLADVIRDLLARELERRG